jgi:hypothetical protein
VIIDRFTNITIAAGKIAEESTSAAVTSGLSYEQRLAAFNAEVAGLVRKYFPEA